jgi:hypothetical protein
MGFYSSVHRDSRIKKIVALGGTFRLAGLQKYLQQNLQLEVEKLNELAAGAPADSKLATSFNQNLLSLISAYGLAIQAMNQAKINSNLLPQHIRREKMWRDKTKWFGAAAAMFVLGAGLGIGSYYWQSIAFAAAQPIRQKDDQLIKDATDLGTKWSQDVEGSGGGPRGQINNIRGMTSSRGMWATLLPDILNTAGPFTDPKAGPIDQQIKQIMSLPRTQRKIVQIEKVTNQYLQHDDLIRAASGFLDPGEPPSAMNFPDGCRGYLFTLNITTPHSDGYLFVLNEYRPRLAKLNKDWMDQWNAEHPKSPKNYYITKVFKPRNSMQFIADSARMNMLSSSYDAMVAVTGRQMTPVLAPQRPANQFASGGPTVAGPMVDVTKYVDRSTNEDPRLDFEMTINFLVVLDPH